MGNSLPMGMNRTGIDSSPLDSKEMIRDAELYSPKAAADGHMMDSIERRYIEESEHLGSVPIPATVRGTLKAALKKMTGRNPEMLINKLGERLAYERSGVRLYDNFIVKSETLAAIEGTSPVRMDELRKIRDEEAAHFHLLEGALEAMGADPTAQTPDADVSGVAASGIQKVLSDPRTTLSQCLEMLLALELVDNAAWELLIKLADDMGLEDMANRFRQALEQEEEHLRRVRSWYEESVITQAGMGAPH